MRAFTLQPRRSCRVLTPVFRGLVLFAAAALAASAQTPGEARKRGGGDDGGRRAVSPQDLQARMLAGLRERFGVESDEEWAVISARILKINELRRGAGGPGAGAFAARGGAPGGDASRGRPTRAPSSPELGALQAAVRDRLPEAEIKARLAQLRETRKANEAKLAKAQEDLRAVLTVQQEALAVLFGLIP